MSSPFSKGRSARLAAEDLYADDAPVAEARNPFASFAPGRGTARETAAETKVYEVPRELIEIARARASGAEPAGTTTPIAPRPDAALQATLRAYTERLSSKPPRVPSVCADEATSPETSATEANAAAATPVETSITRVTAGESLAPIASGACPADDEVAVETTRIRAVPITAETISAETLLLERPLARGSVPLARAGRAVTGSRLWLAYAALSLMGLASCAHVLLGP